MNASDLGPGQLEWKCSLLPLRDRIPQAWIGAALRNETERMVLLMLEMAGLDSRVAMGD